MNRPHFFLLLALLAFPCAVSAQREPWERIGLIEQGKKVEVRQMAGPPVSGTFQGFDATQMNVLQRGGYVVAIPRSNVARVSLVIGKSRGKKAAIAFGVTAGALGALAGAACLAHNTCAGDGAGLAAAVVATWAAIAGGIAALFPPHKETIYQPVPDPASSGKKETPPKRR